MRPFHIVTASLLWVGLTQSPRANAQSSGPEDSVTLSFSDYMAQVDATSLDIRTARLSLPVAAAGERLARMRPNPSLTVGLLQADISGEGAPTASILGVDIPLELGGKRRSRVDLARATSEFARAEIESLAREVRIEAALAYVDALEAARVLELREQTLRSFDQLVDVNRRRLAHGDIGETAFIQSRVESQRFRADLLAAGGEARAAYLTLAIYAEGDPDSAYSITPTGDLAIRPREFDEPALLARAQRERPELLAQELAIERSNRALDLAHATRILDITLSVSWTHNGSTNEPQFMQRSNDLLGAQLTLPLPFANRHRGGIEHALGTVAVAESALGVMRMRVAIDVRRALARYRASVERLAIYDDGLISGADDVLSRLVYEYERGGSSLLEVLNAQRTANEVHISYLGALADHARALVRLQAAAGAGDISL